MWICINVSMYKFIQWYTHMCVSEQVSMYVFTEECMHAGMLCRHVRIHVYMAAAT